MRAQFTVAWTQAAVDAPLSIIDSVLDRDGAEAAERLYRQITHAAAGVQTMPGRGRVVPERETERTAGYRELLVDPYRSMCTVRSSEVVVVTVLDGRGDLGEVLIARALREQV